VADPQIVGLGGSGDTDEATARLLAHVVGLAGKASPKVCVVPTATGDDPAGVLRLYERLPSTAVSSWLPVFPWPPQGLREFVLGHDVVFVGGGNTANMLSIWRVHGLDAILREAWAAGVVLTGWSAGMICWFEAGVTDSFGPQLDGMRDGLGFLPGSACPHYDGEERRRPVYRAAVAGGFPGGYAADDHAALRFDGTDLVECVAGRAGASAWSVALDDGEVVERALPTRVL
jgi:dipeptidase E